MAIPCRHPREGGDPLALKFRFFPQASWQMDSRLRGNDGVIWGERDLIYMRCLALAGG